MIQLRDLNPHNFPLTNEQLENLKRLLPRLQQLEINCGVKFICTTGFRSWDDHIRIYKNKAKKKQFPFLDGVYDESKVPMKSKHLLGQAADIADPTGKIGVFLLNNEKLLENLDLFYEVLSSSPGWCHLQNVPYGSWIQGKSRSFYP